MKNTVGIIGLGRFGKTLADLLAEDFVVYGSDPHIQKTSAPVKLVDLNTLLQQETLFISVPIRNFETVIKNIAPHLKKNTTIIDVCSVKIYPVKIMQEYLPENIGIIATHPLFGPDSIHNSHPLKMMMNNTRDTHKQYEKWKPYFFSKNMTISEMTPDEHDQEMAQSQTVAHFIGRVLQEANIKSTSLNTQGFQKLLEVLEQTQNDSWELFCDMIHYNPYAKTTIENLENAMKQLKAKVMKH